MEKPNPSQIPTYQEWLVQKLTRFILMATEEEAQVVNSFITGYFSEK